MVKKHQILHDSQEGFRAERSTARQLQIIIAALEDARFTNQAIYVLYIDFKNAFGSINHARRLLAIMKDLGYPHDAVALIGNIYSKSTTTFTGEHFGKTEPIPIQRGTIQGDTLSPYIFIIFLEPLLRWLQRGNNGYTFKTSNTKLSSAAYADDLAAISHNLSSLQLQLDKLDKYCEWAGMDLGIPKCAVTGCPNKSKLNSLAFKIHLQAANINFRGQPIPTLSQHEPYVYLGINLVPSLQWKTQIHITTTKLIKQCKLLLTSPATMKQKIQMVNTVIRAGIAYNFYAVPYSLLAIKKLDKRIIALHKTICGHPKCMSNAATQLSHNMFGTEAFSLKNAYITCIGEQLINALNDQGRLGIIYTGLTTHILAKHGGSLNLPRISPHDCTRSPITRTLYLLKTIGGAHLKSTLVKFPLLTTPIETQWMQQMHNIPTLTTTSSLTYLHKLILHNITDLKQLTHPNGTHLITNEEFKYYYDTPTKAIKATLDHIKTLFCEPTCQSQCPHNCLVHAPPNTLKAPYRILNHQLHPRIRTQYAHPPPLPPPEHPRPPIHIQHKHSLYPIHSIINDRSHTYIDKNNITKKYTSYLCQWIAPNDLTYNKWLSQRDLFPWESQNTINHNILLLTQYYTNKQHRHFTNILNDNFVEAQVRDTRHISPPLNIPLCRININECNPDIDIALTQPTIQSQHGASHIYDEEGRHLITIPEQRLQWLWKQYQNALHQPHNLEPPIQSFEQEVTWLYRRYKYKIPKDDPLKLEGSYLMSNEQ